MLRKFKTPIEWSDINYQDSVNYRHVYNAPNTVIFRGNKIMLSCGTSDSVRLFTLHSGGLTTLIEVSVNDRLCYFGVTEYNSEGVQLNSMFEDSSESYGALIRAARSLGRGDVHKGLAIYAFRNIFN